MSPSKISHVLATTAPTFWPITLPVRLLLEVLLKFLIVMSSAARGSTESIEALRTAPWALLVQVVAETLLGGNKQIIGLPSG